MYVLKLMDQEYGDTVTVSSRNAYRCVSIPML